MAERTAWRLLEAARPYAGRFCLGLLATLFASLLYGVTIVVLVPLLKALFGTAGALPSPGTALERVTALVRGPLIAGLPPRAPLERGAGPAHRHGDRAPRGDEAGPRLRRGSPRGGLLPGAGGAVPEAGGADPHLPRPDTPRGRGAR